LYRVGDMVLRIGNIEKQEKLYAWQTAR